MSSKKEFRIIMYSIVESLCDKIADFYKIDYKSAREMLYNSKLYELLEKEKNKIWYFSTSYLFDMFKNEQETGILKIYEG